MVCKKCGAELLDTDRFCINCGMQVDVKIENCPFCGEKLREGEKFCHRCGSEIPVPGEEVGPPAGSYPGGLNTTEISALSDAVIAAAQMELRGSSRSEVEEPESPAQEERPRLRRVAPRQEPEEAPKRKKRASAEKRRAAEQPGDKDELLNKLILGAGAVLLVAVAAALFLFARNEGLIPGGRPAQSEAGLTEAEEAEEPASVVAGESETQAEEEALINEEPLGRLKVTAGTLNIRNGASTQGTQIIGKAKKGEVYPYLSEENGWFFIDLGGGEGGYVNEEFVEKE